MNLNTLKKHNLPDKPGVYLFKKGKMILYIGKATSLKDRTKSYFSKDLIATRGPAILDMVVQADNVDWKETDSVLEALILEAELIKKYKPKYNTKEKDDKSFNYVCITDEEIPKVIVKRGRNLKKKYRNFLVRGFHGDLAGFGEGRRTENYDVSLEDYNGRKNVVLPLSATFGPYTNGLQLREAMKIIRRIFPFVDGDSIKKNNKEFYRQLGLTPDGVKEYMENIRNLKLFFQGKKKKIIQNLKKEMLLCAKKKEFEKANGIKKQIFALEHINDIALIKSESLTSSNFSVLRPSQNTGWDSRTFKIERGSAFNTFRVEAYDVAHMSGKNMVGVMTVIENGEVAKNEYKKFIIKTQSGANDTGALEEILSRRFRHAEWGIPDLVVVDGSIAQINVAKRVLNRYQFKIPVVGVVKDDKHKAKAIQGDETIIKKYKSQILLANSEAHRFAIKFYRSKSRKNMIV